LDVQLAPEYFKSRRRSLEPELFDWVEASVSAETKDEHPLWLEFVTGVDGGES
jgi:hypothetical protein